MSKLNRHWTVLLLLAALCWSINGTAQLTESFTATGELFLDLQGAPETPQRTDNPPSGTGFRWGAYATPSSGSQKIKLFDVSGTRVLHFASQQRAPANYAYTIFDEAGGNAPTHTVDLSSANAEVVIDVYNVPTAGSVKFMVRSGFGSWFLSDTSLPITGTGTASFKVADTTWASITAKSNGGSLDALAGADEAPLDIGTAAIPDLKKVDGGGIYISEQISGGTTRFQLKGITWNGPVTVKQAETAVWPVFADFEEPDYSVGPLSKQKGWNASNNADVQKNFVASGVQAVKLAIDASAEYAPQNVPEKVVWFDVTLKPQPSADYMTLPAPEGATCVLLFHQTDGIVCLDGDGQGYGQWVETGITPQAWTRVSIRQDYNNHVWDLYIDGVEKVIGLGNAHNSTGFTRIDFQAGRYGALYFDDLYSGTTPPSELEGDARMPLAGGISIFILIAACGLALIR